MNRIDRLTAIIIFLQGRKFVSINELAERYNISERTAYRDLRALEEAGVPIGFESGKGYFVMRGYHLPPVMFNKSEAASLLAGERLMQRWNSSELGKSYQSALDKIRSILPSDDLQYFESMDKHIQTFPYEKIDNPIPNERIFSQLQQAIFKKEVVELIYKRAYSDKETQRKVEPLGLLVMGRYWYLAAWCMMREDYRMFRLDRIVTFTKTGITLREPQAHTLKDYYDSNLNKDKEFTEVVVRFKKEHARYVGDQKYWHGWAWEKEVGNYIEMSFLSSTMDYLSSWLLTWTTYVEILSPPEMQDRMCELTEKLVRHYSQKES